jgi:anti-sigma B factor antagonist
VTFGEPAFCVSSEVDGERAVVLLVGELDLQTAPQLREELVGLLDRGVNDLVLDLADLDFIDSSGLSVLIMALKRLREREGELRLRAVPARARRVLELSGLDRAISMVDE